MTISDPDSNRGTERPAGGDFTPGPPVIRTWGLDSPAAYLRAPLVDAVPADMGRSLAVAALGIGLLSQLLFVGQGIGVNVVVWTALLLAVAAAARRRDTAFDLADAWIAPAALIAAVLLAVRADAPLVAFDAVATLVLVGAAVASLAGISVTRRSVGGLMSLFVRGGVVATSGATALAPGVRSTARGAGALASGKLRRVGAGLLIAIPILVVFAALFAAADAVFSRALSQAFTWNVDLGSVPVRIAIAAAATWAGAGMLVLVVAAGRRIHADEPFVPPARLGGLEATVALVAIDLLFAVFVALQATYLFGGRDTLAATGLTYADYARRGFWELVTVAALVGVLVCVLETVVRERGRAYRSASLLLVALTGVVLVSAAVRLGLYQQAYGWTELRFYVLTAIGWLALCLLAAAVTVATGRSRWLPHATVALGLVVALGANLVGPQSFVAQQNVARALDPSLVAPGGRAGLDVEYLGSLGDGAVPVLLDALPSLDPADRAIAIAALRERRDALRQESANQGWPSWNLERESARARLEAAPLP